MIFVGKKPSLGLFIFHPSTVRLGGSSKADPKYMGFFYQSILGLPENQATACPAREEYGRKQAWRRAGSSVATGAAPR